MAHETASVVFLRSRFHVPNPSSGIESRVRDCDGVNMVFGSRGNWAVGLLADVAMPARENTRSNVGNIIFDKL